MEWRVVNKQNLRGREQYLLRTRRDGGKPHGQAQDQAGAVFVNWTYVQWEPIRESGIYLRSPDRKWLQHGF